jgi:hypothetical protein
MQMIGLYFTLTHPSGDSDLLVIADLTEPENFDYRKDHTVAWTLFDPKTSEADGLVCHYNPETKDSKCISFATVEDGDILGENEVSQETFCSLIKDCSGRHCKRPTTCSFLDWNEAFVKMNYVRKPWKINNTWSSAWGEPVSTSFYIDNINHTYQFGGHRPLRKENGL